MTTLTALRIITQLPALRGSHLHLDPYSLVNAYWDEVFPGQAKPTHEVKVWHNTWDEVVDMWKAANMLEEAAYAHLVARLDTFVPPSSPSTVL